MPVSPLYHWKPLPPSQGLVIPMLMLMLHPGSSHLKPLMSACLFSCGRLPGTNQALLFHKSCYVLLQHLSYLFIYLFWRCCDRFVFAFELAANSQYTEDDSELQRSRLPLSARITNLHRYIQSVWPWDSNPGFHECHVRYQPLFAWAGSQSSSMIFLPLLPKSWNYRGEPLYLSHPYLYRFVKSAKWPPQFILYYFYY